MKFQRSTLILVGVACLLGAGVLIAEAPRSPSPEATTQTESTGPIFTFAETDVATLTVDRGDETLAFEQGNDGTWQMTAPDNVLAEPGAVAFLLSRLTTDSPLQTVTMSADQAADFGFTTPAGVVTVTRQDGTVHKLILGGPDFSGGADYAVVDPDPWPPAEGQDYAVLVVTRDVANGINRPVAEWKLPVETLAPEGTQGEVSPAGGNAFPVDAPGPDGAAVPAPAQDDADTPGAP